jgi:1-acyl-sn-glycerol-3-phosphate acyltransferase
MGSPLRAATRALAFGWHLLRGFLTSFRLRLRHGRHWHQTPQGLRAYQDWMQHMARILGLRVTCHNEPIGTPVMLVANHVSWLDIVAIASCGAVRFLAKDTVRHWPVIGALASFSGTLFIRRDTPSVLRETNQLLSSCLKDGQRIIIFPEGTSTDGRGMEPFRPALFEAARTAQCPVQPVAIRYLRDNTLDRIAPYCGDDIFISHLWRVLRMPETYVELNFRPALDTQAPRKALAQQSHASISAALETALPLQAPAGPQAAQFDVAKANG